MPNRPKITYRILFCQPHSTCYCSYPHPDSLKLHRSHHSNNRPWPHIIYIILPSKLKLRARTNIVITALYSIYILIMTQRSKYTHHINNITPSFTREKAFIALHILPLLFLSLNPKIILGPCILQNRFLNNIRTSSIIWYMVHYGVLNMVPTLRSLRGWNDILPTHWVTVWKSRCKQSCSSSNLI
eukprot:bmy_11176T0